MDGLEVNGELLVTVADDENADKTRAVTVSSLDLVSEATLVDDLEARLKVTGLSHGDQAAALGDIDHAVLLVDGAHHGVLDDGGRRVRNDAGFLVKLTGEEIDTEITMLTRGGRGGGADQLAGTGLEDDNIADADVVAGNGVGAAVLGTSNGDAATTIAARRLGGRDVDLIDLLDGPGGDAGRVALEGVEESVSGGAEGLEAVAVDIGIARATHFLGSFDFGRFDVNLLRLDV
jgi:hypothetical protein